MKIKVGELRKLIKEELKPDPLFKTQRDRYADFSARKAVSDRKGSDELNLSNWEGFRVGDWVYLKDGTIGQIRKFTRHEPTANRAEFITAFIITHLGYNMEQRAEIILHDAREATHEERKEAMMQGEEERARVAGTIDTSREGT
jgi:hypothetical protein